MKRSCVHHLIVAFLIVLSVSTMFGCAATQVAIEKRNLAVQTKMSETVFLDPVGPDRQTVFIQVKNTSDKEIEIAPDLSDAIAKRGYRVIQDPNLAHFMLQVNILSVGKTDPVPAVPDWPQFMQGCIKYRRSLDEQAPGAPRTKKSFRE